MQAVRTLTMAAAASFAAAAWGASYQYIAETVAPAAKQGAVKVGALTWSCQANRCTISGPWPTPGVAACRALAQTVGMIKSYGHGKTKLSALELQQCNSGIAAASIPPPQVPRHRDRAVTGSDFGAIAKPAPGVNIGRVAPPTPTGGGAAAEHSDAARKSPPAPVHQLDRSSGAVKFGDGQTGARPPAGGRNVIGKYRVGGGEGAAPATTIPLRLRTAGIQYQGRGDRTALDAGFRPLRLRTAGIVYAGRGDRVALDEGFAPLRLRTQSITYRGASR